MELSRTAAVVVAMSIGGEAVNASVCKTDIRGFNSRPVLHKTVRFPKARILNSTHLESSLLRVVPSRFASVSGPIICRAFRN